MIRPGLIFVLVWVVGLLVRLVFRSSRRARARQGPGSSDPWGETRWGQGRYQTSNHSPKTQSPYEVLEVSPGASQDEITAAFRRLVHQYHPDKVANLAPEFRELAERRMKEINAAYEQLRRYTSR